MGWRDGGIDDAVQWRDSKMRADCCSEAWMSGQRMDGWMEQWVGEWIDGGMDGTIDG